MEKRPDGASSHERASTRLPAFILIAGIALSGLGALHHFGSPGGSGNGTQSTRDGKVENAQTAHVAAQLPVIPAGWAQKALERSNYSKQDKERILAAYKRRDLSLIQMPIAEIDGKVGDTVKIDAGGFSQVVTLSATLKAVTLPIHHMGEVTISPAHMVAGNALAAGVLTVYGMYSLPTLTSSELVTLDVIAQ
ncbi:hypothetical protein [Asaia sp. HN010]|uniref:hypothetical protein n=1 Tax=Asaia sp. HN010 TaxID=3081233 RepID=UPI0030197003